MAWNAQRAGDSKIMVFLEENLTEEIAPADNLMSFQQLPEKVTAKRAPIVTTDARKILQKLKSHLC